MERKFHFCKVERVLEVDGGDGCLAVGMYSTLLFNSDKKSATSVYWHLTLNSTKWIIQTHKLVMKHKTEPSKQTHTLSLLRLLL